MNKTKLNTLIQKLKNEKIAIKELILINDIQEELDKIKKDTLKRV